MAKSFLLLNECDVSNKCGARCLMAFNWKGQCVQEGKVSKRANFQLGRDDIYAFCMLFHVRWIFLTTSLRIPSESRCATRVLFGDEW